MMQKSIMSNRESLMLYAIGRARTRILGRKTVDILLLIILASFADEDGVAEVSTIALCANCNASNNTVLRGIKHLDQVRRH